MTRAILLRGNDDAAWLLDQFEQENSEVIVFGSIRQEPWFRNRWQVVDLVNTADLQEIFRAIRRHKVTSISFFGKPFSNIQFNELSKQSRVEIKKLKPKLESLPNVYFEALSLKLKDEGVGTYNIGEILPKVNREVGHVWGASIANHRELVVEARGQMGHRPWEWVKHGVLFLEDGSPHLERSGTKTLLRTMVSDGANLAGSVLVKLEFPRFANLDTPVIESRLINVCIKNNVAGIITGANAIIIDEPRLKKLAEAGNLSVVFA